MIKEKARRPRRTVKGTVLFTVVCVMMVLIVFLMGTLALAATANRRANYKYQRAQNETIARTVIDAVVTDIKNDTSSDGLNNALANKTSFDMQVELDGRQYPVAVSRGGKQCWYDATLGWVEGDIINLTATVASQSGNEPVNYNASIVMAITTTNNNNNVNPNPAGGAFVSMGGISPKIGTNGLTTGGTEVNLNGSPTDVVDIGHSNSVRIETPVYINGIGDMKTDVKLYIPAMQYTGDTKASVFFAVTGDLLLQNSPLRTEFGSTMNWKNQTSNSTDYTSYVNIPCMFVGGTIYANTKAIELGNENNAMNLYCGSFQTGNGMKVYGDVYCFDAAKTSTSGGSATPEDNTLYEWASKTIKYKTWTEDPHKFGNLYSKGNLDISKSGGSVLKIGGDVRAEGDIKISGANISGDLVCGKTLIIGNDVTVHGNIYADTLIITATNGVKCNNAYINTLACGKIEATQVYYDKKATSVSAVEVSRSTVNVVVSQHYNYNTEKLVYNLVITMPDNSTVTLPQEIIGTYDGDHPALPTPSSPTVVGGDHPNSTGNISGTEFKKGSHNIKIYPEGFTEADIKSDILTIPQVSDYSDPTSFPTTRTDLNALVTIQDSHNTLLIPSYNIGDNTTPETITNSCILTGTACRDYTIKPNGTIAVIVNDVTFDGKKLIIDDTNGTVLIFVEGTFKFSASGCGLWTKHYKDLIDANGYQFTVTRTSQADYPNVYIYGAAGSVIDCDGNPLITANIRAPKTTYKGKTGIDGSNITYVDAASTTMDYIGVIGQVIAGDIEVDNGWGLAYVEPGNNGGGGNGGGNHGNNGNNQTITYSSNGGSINYTIY